ncbi:MAG: D-2-hydroxyacid dehydrogenase [Gammaproteobacteria bacterium]|nr:D-2-hydroxyacid dehydrogenase [Gammaproteobacteria bacterium]
MKAAFLDFDTLGPSDINTSALRATLPGIELYGSSTDHEINTRIADCEILLVNKVSLDRARLTSVPSLRLVVLAATGTDNVDLVAARELGIAVCNIRNYATPSVVQHVFGLLLALTLRLDEYRQLLQRGAWQASPHFCLLDFPGRELSGRTLGIVGYGQLGQAVGAVGQAFGMRVVAARSLRPAGHRPGEHPAAAVDRLPLPELLTAADVVSLHCPLTPETRHLINQESLGRMRPDAVLINTARGNLVDYAALLAALRSGQLGGAGIDVLPEEPPVAGHPLLAVRLPNLIVTPHIGWAARESRQRALDEIVANLQAFLSGGHRNRVA